MCDQTTHIYVFLHRAMSHSRSTRWAFSVLGRCVSAGACLAGWFFSSHPAVAQEVTFAAGPASFVSGIYNEYDDDYGLGASVATRVSYRLRTAVALDIGGRYTRVPATTAGAHSYESYALTAGVQLSPLRVGLFAPYARLGAGAERHRPVGNGSSSALAFDSGLGTTVGPAVGSDFVGYVEVVAAGGIESLSSSGYIAALLGVGYRF